MALAGDHVQQILLDSTYRNRKKFPNPTEFEATVRPEQSTMPSDPVGVGYILYKSAITVYDGSTSPHRIQIPAAIDVSINRLLGRHVEVVDSGTYLLKGTSTVVGFSTDFMYIYISPSIPVAINPGDILFIRQLTSSPLIRFNPSAPVAAGATSFQFSGGSKKEDAYKGMFMRKVNGTLGTDHRILSYDVSTVPPTVSFAPAVEVGGFAAADFIEIYKVDDNEGGLSEMGAVANRGIPMNHEIRLEWLRIPRHPLYVNNDTDPVVGSVPLNVNNFSYLLVEFRNRSFGSAGIIQSNNRHSRNAQFIVPIEDISTGVGKFYSLRSPSTITIQYSPNDTIHFSVKLPHGQTIQFDPEDEQADSLALPNPDMQVTAMFSVRRVLM